MEQLQEEEKRISPERDVSMVESRLSSDDLPEPKAAPPKPSTGQYEDALEERTEERRVAEGYSSISDSEGYNPNALYCICRQKHNKRFMICCDSCLEWFHGDCVGIDEAKGRQMERRGQDYMCPSCTAKKQRLLDFQPEPPTFNLPECLTLPPSGQEEEVVPVQQALPAAMEAPLKATEDAPEAMETTVTDSSLPQCIGPGCAKHALPDSVYCGTVCILQHASVTMKSLSTAKESKAKTRPQRKAAKAAPKGQRYSRISRRSAGRLEEESEEEEEKETEKKEEEEEESSSKGEQEEVATPEACDPDVTAVQATSIAPSKFYNTSNEDREKVDAKTEPLAPHSPERDSPDPLPCSGGGPEPSPPRGAAQGKTKKSAKSGTASKKLCLDSTIQQCIQTKSSPNQEAPGTSVSRHHETGALRVTKTSFIIPKKQPGQPPAPVPPSSSDPTPPPPLAPSLPSETRNLPVSPAPIAPSSRPSQPNNQVRHSIQRSLTSILYKRVCEVDDLEMSEGDVGKLVTNIEMEMFDIFRNTDSKYMNKYRTIMFNLKDPKNKGLLYRVIGGDIGPFRLARMSQRDMQATTVPEPSTTESAKESAKPPCGLAKPESVRLELPSLSMAPSRSERNVDQKRSVPPPLKARPTQQSQNSSLPDILNCMLQDTTADHKKHLFDLKCKICTGRVPAEDQGEPILKKPKVSESKDRREYGPSWTYTSTAERPWRGAAGDESPLRAPPDSPDLDSPTSLVIVTDSPASPIMESPASPVMQSPSSPTLESPASPVVETPLSPTSDSSKGKRSDRSYTPVVIPAVSTVTITRRDPRTAASRPPTVTSDTAPRSPGFYAPVKEAPTQSKPVVTVPPSPSLQPPTVPKSILTKPSDPRLYGASGSSSRAATSHSPPDGETTQFLAKQEILWKGFLNMISVAKFVTKGYLVSGSPECLKVDLPDTIQIGGRIMPQTVWEYVSRVKTSVTKELCVIRFHPATEEEEVAYVSLFSYFSSRRRFGVVANSSRSIKDIYLVPLSAKEAIPAKLLPFEGLGLERNRPNLLLGLAICQKPKRPGSLPQEGDEKRSKVQMSKDPMWIPKPPMLYGSGKLEIFQPYDPETPLHTTPPGSPPATGSLSDSSSSGSINIPSLQTSAMTIPSTKKPASASAPTTTTTTVFDKTSVPSVLPTATTTTSASPLQTILKTLFGSDTTPAPAAQVVAHLPLPPPPPAVDPIVQQYGQKSKVKAIEEEENEYDRPYDPEEEYDPSMRYRIVAPLSLDILKANRAAPSVDDDVAYDPEDDTIFEDMNKDASKVTKTSTSVPSAQAGVTIPAPAPAPAPAPVPVPVYTPTPGPASVTTPEPAVSTNLQNFSSNGVVVVSAATLTEQQRMLEELNRQIEEQKRQLKEQEEALRQQREAVGMFMAHFSVSDALMSPPSKSLAPNGQSKAEQTDGQQPEIKGLDGSSVDNTTMDQAQESINPSLGPESGQTEDNSINPDSKNENEPEKDESKENLEEGENYFSAGEIVDSDVAYDPEDDSIFNDIFQRGKVKVRESSVTSSGHGGSRKDNPAVGHHDRRRRQSPKRRSRRDRDHNESPSRKSTRRSPSRSQRRRERERHRRSERDRSRHRARGIADRQGHHRRERNPRRRSGAHKRSPSSPRKRDSASFSPVRRRRLSPLEPKSQEARENTDLTAPGLPTTIINSSQSNSDKKNKTDGTQSKCDHSEAAALQQGNKDNASPEVATDHLPSINIIDPLTSNAELKDSISMLQSSTSSLMHTKQGSVDKISDLKEFIRDSPQSPDPEPQFVKPRVEKMGIDITQKGNDPVTDTSCAVPPVSGQNSDSILGQATREEIKWPGLGPLNMGGSDIRPADVKFSGPHLRDPASRPDIKNNFPNRGNEMSVPGFICLSMEGRELRGPNIRGPGLDMMSLGPDIRGPGIDMRRAGTDIVDERRGLRQNNMGTELRGPGTHTSIMQGPGMRGPVLDMLANWSENRSLTIIPEMPGSCMKGADLTGSGPDVPHPHPGADMKGDGVLGEWRGQEIPQPGPRSTRSNTVHPQGIVDKRPRHLKRDRWTDATASDVDETNPMHCRPDMIEERLVLDSRGIAPEMRNSGPGMRGRGRGMRSRGRGIRGQSPDRWGPEPVTKGQSPDFREPGTEIGGPGLNTRGPVSSMRGLQQIMTGLGPDVQSLGQAMRDLGQGLVVRGHSPDLRRPGPNMRGRGPDRRGSGSDMRDPVPDVRAQGPDIRSLRASRRGRGRGTRSESPDRIVHGQDRHPGPPRTEIRGRGPSTRSQSPNSRDPEPAWGYDKGAGAEGREPGPERRQPGPHLRGQRQDRTQERDRSPRERRAPRPDRREPFPDIHSPDMADERQGPGPGNRGPGMMGPGPNAREEITGPCMRGPGPELGRPGSDLRDERRGRGEEMGGQDFRGPGPNMRDPSQDVRGEMRGPQMRNPGQNMGRPNAEMGLNIRGPNVEGLGPDMTPEQDTRRPNMRGPGPELRNKVRGQETCGPGPDMRNPNWTGPGLNRGGPDMPNEWRGPNMGTGMREERRGPEVWHERGGPDVRHPEPDMRPDSRGPDIRGPGPDLRDQEWRGPGSDMRNNWRGPNMMGPGTDFRGELRGPDVIVPDLDGSGPDRRGSGPNFRGTGFDGRGPNMEGPGPDFRGESMEGLRPNRGDEARGDERRGPDFRVSGPDRRGLNVEGPGLNRRGPTMGDEWREPDFRGSIPERLGPNMESPSLDRGGPGQDFGIIGLNRQGHSAEGHGPNRRGPNIDGQWSERRDLNIGEERSGPDFRVPRPDRRGPNMDSAGPNRRGPNIEGPDLDKRGPRPDFRGSGPDMRGPNMQDSEADWIGPDFKGPGQDRSVTTMDCLELDIRGPGLRGPNMDGPGLDRREPGPRGPDMDGPGSDRRGTGPRGPNMDGPGPDRRGPGLRGPDMDGPGLDRRGPGPRGPDVDGPSPDRRGPGSRGPNMDGPGFDRRGPGSRGPNMDGPGLDRRGPGPRGPNMDGPGLDRRRPGPRGPNMDGSGSDRRGPGPRGPDMDGPGPDRRGPGPRGPDMDGPGPDRRGPGPRGPDMDGPGPDRRGPGPRGPNMDGPGPERRGPGPRGPNMDGPGPDRRGPGPRGPDMDGPGPDRRGPGPRGPNMDGPGPDRRGPGARGPNMDGPGSDRRGPGPRGPNMGGEWRGENMEGQCPNRRSPGPNFKGQGPERRDSNMECIDSDRRWTDRGGPVPGWKDPNMECPDNQGPDFRGAGPDRRGQNIDGPEHNRSGLRMGDKWRRYDRRESEPNVQGSVLDFRRERSGPNMEGQGPDSRGPDFRRDMRGLRQEMDNEWRDPDRPDTNMQGPDWRGPDMKGPGQDFRGDMRGPNMWGPGPDRRGPGMDGPGPDRRGLRSDFHGEMRGPGNMGPNMGPNRCPEQDTGCENFDGHRSPNWMNPNEWNRTQDVQGQNPDRKRDFTPPHFNSPQMSFPNQQGNVEGQRGPHPTGFTGPRGPHPSQFNQPRGPAPDNGGQPRFRFDNPQQPKHKAPLLPTPTEGIFRLPNWTKNNLEVFNKDLRSNQSPDSSCFPQEGVHGREWNRARSVSRDRDLNREAGRQEPGGDTLVKEGPEEQRPTKDKEIDKSSKERGHCQLEHSKSRDEDFKGKGEAENSKLVDSPQSKEPL